MNGIYGRAATGLADTSWAVNEAVARVGAKGEQLSETILNGFGQQAAVMHDLRVPIPGFKANMDHIIVSGKRVMILDSKMWKPGFYWSLGGVNRRGFEKVPHTAKDQTWVSEAVSRHLKGTGASVLATRLVIWPSRPNEPLRTAFLRVPGAVIIPGRSLEAAARTFIGRTPADDRIVSRLAELIVKPSRSAAGYR
ncbi:nuclease-related domain-containing protein [Arthrobacter caoxuetaonis]|uniref:NERD domain-containing protein n=1 Tax=Arthrobacter caoxuetaonis TaxID=2886935 RepID=A0A9X1MI46_9MICC|nr:nuclease-related domain-containing protein [Arthrobacter caoxuetaonis]MCC3299332.1 NERD domain-containing protein [Arthrobacter caoxuetaonis]USQ59175.1 NERD domain-containing protein [Arthrobacter caoxuetaonis]